MKEGIKAIGKAAVYFSVYFLIQIIVSVVFEIGIAVEIATEMMAADEELDTWVLTEKLTEELMSHVMLMTLVAGIVTLLVFWIVFLIRKKKFRKEVCAYPIPVKGILPIAVMAAGFNVITTVMISLIPWPQSWMDSYISNSSVIDSSLLSWIAAVLMAPVLEEIVFRGLMYTRLKKGLPMIVAAVITSLAFGAAHGTMIWTIYTFIFGMLLIWVFEKFQSLIACIVLHMAYNLSGMALSMIPAEAGIVIILLLAVSIAGVYFSYGEIVKITAMIPQVGESDIVAEEMNEKAE